MARMRIEIPRALLERAAAMGRTLGDIQRDMRRLGVEVSLPTIRARLGQAGIMLPRQYNAWTPAKASALAAARQAERSKAIEGPRRKWRWGSTVVGRRPDNNFDLFGTAGRFETARATRRIEAYELEMRALQDRVRSGDAAAAATIKRRWGLRIYTAAECAAESNRRCTQMNADGGRG